MKKKRRKKPKKEVWQKHHITYDPEWIEEVTRAEHFYITRLNRFNSLSWGSRVAILYILLTKPIKIKS
jgi:hypothetical protein